MDIEGIQDFYPDDVAHCYGCGKLNEHGHKIKTNWDGDETLTHFTPKDYHTAIPGYVYGGLIASLIDCHGTGSAALAAYRIEKREPGTLPPFRFVTASLHVDYLKPTPLGVELEIRGKITEVKDLPFGKLRRRKKVITEITVSANGEVTARGIVVAVQMPENMVK
jgi:acyl-coenzyme A thioesterase PaaI-like protein